MTTTRRRPVDPNLSWPPGGVGRHYRVAVRNEETGEQRTIYDGGRPSCRLPADYRLSSDQLAFRVESRFADDVEAPFRRLVDYTGIDRVGDDFETPAPDLIVGEARERATCYRLVVRDKADRDRRFSDFVRAEPRFLLPPGRLTGQEAEWAVLARVDDRWTSARWRPVTEDMVNAALARAERLIDVPREPSPRDAENDSPWRPGQPDARGAHGVGLGRRLLVAVDVTADPGLASGPDPRLVVAEQWFDDAGGGLVAHVAETLQTQGLTGVFFLDTAAGDALAAADNPLSALAHRLEAAGHSTELMIRRHPWDALFDREGEKIEAAVARAVDRFTTITGRRPRLARIATDDLNTKALEALANAGVGGVVTRPVDQARLPRWMQARIHPFAARDELTVIPVTTLVSTPAHTRDRVVRHAVEGADAMVAGMAHSFARAVVAPEHPGAPDETLVTAFIDPLTLLAVQYTVSPVRADAWNETLRRERSAWLTAGWARSEGGFSFSDGRSEVMLDIFANLVRGLAEGGLRSISADDVDPRRLAQSGEAAWERILEHRRGARLIRPSIGRRYDNAYRQALLVGSPQPPDPASRRDADDTSRADSGRADAYARGLAALGATEGARVALSVSRRGDGLAAALASALRPHDLAALEWDPGSGGLPEIEGRNHDLIASAGVLGVGDLAEAVAVVKAFSEALAAGGRLALVIETYATRTRTPGVGRDDVILFPELAGLGHLGDETQRRTALTPAGWLALISGTGLKIEAVAGYGEERPEKSTLANHPARFAPFDENEIGTGRLLVIAVRE